MHPVDLIHQALPTSDPDYPAMDLATEPGICCLTGAETETVARKKALGKSFCDGAELAAPESDRLGVAAYVALRYKWARMSSWICDGSTFARLDRIGVRDAVFGQPPNKPWAAYATTSYKKHGVLRCCLNQQGHGVWLFENRLADCSDREKTLEWWLHLNHCLRLGFGRSILETMDCPAPVMRKVGLPHWMDFESWARDKYKSALYAFLCYLLPSQEELKAENRKGNFIP